MSDETTSATEPSPADLQRLQQLWHGFRVSQALYVAASLGLADLLADGPQSADALAATTGANADALYRVLRALASIGVFAETTERHFTLTPMARLLQQDHPYSVRAQVIYLGNEPYRAWGQSPAQRDVRRECLRSGIWRAAFPVSCAASSVERGLQPGDERKLTPSGVGNRRRV